MSPASPSKVSRGSLAAGLLCGSASALFGCAADKAVLLEIAPPSVVDRAPTGLHHRSAPRDVDALFPREAVLEPPPREALPCLDLGACREQCTRGDGDSCATGVIIADLPEKDARALVVRGCALGSRVACVLAGLDRLPVRDDRPFWVSCTRGVARAIFPTQ
ncbi:MAG: hypothetical protein U0271_40575 [Polyangiaceae bacterium]